MAESLGLGQIITGIQHRDAIHIAVAPVIAAEDLNPGEGINFSIKGGKTAVGKSSEPIGVVDPFLKQPVKAGQEFWMFLNPGSITSLRHDWTHPSFTREAFEQDATSMAWLIEYGEEVDMTLKELLDTAREYLKTGDIHCLGFNTPEIVYNQRSEFWQHFSRYTGELVEVGKDDTFFRCAC